MGGQGIPFILVARKGSNGCESNLDIGVCEDAGLEARVHVGKALRHMLHNLRPLDFLVLSQRAGRNFWDNNDAARCLRCLKAQLTRARASEIQHSLRTKLSQNTNEEVLTNLRRLCLLRCF